MYVPSIVGSSELTTAPQETEIEPALAVVSTPFIGLPVEELATIMGHELPLARVVLASFIFFDVSVVIATVP
ncbi:unnamed protein product [Phytophthora lilii]|uniref:Unnamed protein product n=1 Tax=Phytophthora lilii TaxID=2077276 RepID=A0A9W6Y9I3_9STRA|nr:unnamed protein product [Phytophthora lilii]